MSGIRPIVILVFCSWVPVVSWANADVDKSRAAFTAGLAAAKSADNAGAVTQFRSALALRPTHPGLMIRLASVLAATGDVDEAAALLKRAAATGQAMNITDQPAYQPLKNHPLFLDAVARARQNLQPVGSGTVVVTGLPSGLIPEGVAHHNGATFVSSVATGRIFRIDSDKSATPLKADASFGSFGLAIDSNRRALWVATSQMPQHEPSRRAKTLSQAGIVRVDLATGETVARYLSANDGREHIIGDLSVAANGDVYATDSKAPHIYRLTAKTIDDAGSKAPATAPAKAPANAPPLTLEPWLSAAEFSSLQGLAFSADGRHVFVADYAVGIARIELATKHIEWLKVPPDTTLLGVDGLYRNGCDLIATQNGVQPNRVLRIALNAAGDNIQAVDVVAANLPGLTDLTLGTLIDGKTLRVIARSDWHAVKPDDTLPATLASPVVMDIRLPVPRCQ